MPSSSRREFLRRAGGLLSAAALVGAAGCSQRSEDNLGETPPTTEQTPTDQLPMDEHTDAKPPTLAPLDGSWESYRHDAANTAAADDSGPTAESTTVWQRTVSLGPPATGIVAADGAFVTVSETGFPMALDAADGTLAWVSERQASTEVDPTVAGDTVVVVGNGTAAGLSPASGEERWTASFAGLPTGVASFGERVFVATEVSILAFSAVDGTRQWRHPVDGQVVTPPAVDDGSVAVGLASGEVLTVDTTSGEVRWREPVGSEPAFAPAVASGRVYHATDSRLVTFDAETGERAWEERLPDPAAGPPVATADGVYVGTLRSNVEYDPEGTPRPTDTMWFELAVTALSSDGTERWQAAEIGQYNFTSGPPERMPLAATADRVYLAVGGKLRAYDAATGERAWPEPVVGTASLRPAVSDGVVSTGTVGASLDDGRVQWEFRAATGVESTPAVVGNTVYVGAEDTNVYALAANSGAVQWRAQTGGAVRSTPAVDEDAVYVGSLDGFLYAFDRGDGTELWRFDTGGQVEASPTLANGTVYVDNFGTLFAIDAGDGTEQWRADPRDRFVPGTPAVADGVVYAGANGVLYAFDAADGSVRWHVQYSQDAVVQSTPAVADGRVYVVLGDSLVAFDAADGTERWTALTGGSIARPPAVRDGTVYVSGDGRVYAFEAGDGTRQWHTPVGGNRFPVAGDGAVYAVSYRDVVALDSVDGTELWRQGGLEPAGTPALAGQYLFLGDRRGDVRAIGPDPE